MISHVATAVDHEVPQGSYVVQTGEKTTGACSNRNIFLTHA